MKLLDLMRIIGKNERIRKPLYRLAMKLLVRPYVWNLKVPIISITGTNGKTTTTQLLDRIYNRAGYSVGTCYTFGVMHNGAIIEKGDHAGGGGIWKAATCPNVDILIFETARKGILDYGLGYYTCQVGIVTNVHEDHLGYDGINTIEEMAEVKSAVVRNTTHDGYVILNGDDPLVRPMANKSKATPIYFVLDNDYNQFENVFFLKDDIIYRKTGQDIYEVIDVKRIPITFGGQQRYNIANIMTVLAAVEGMNKYVPVAPAIMNKTFIDYGTDISDNIGRFCIGTYNNEYIIFCNSKNPNGYMHDVEIINKIKKKGKFGKIVGILTAPGNRRLDSYIEISKIVSSVCDAVFIRPPKKIYLRGRSEDEIVDLLSTHICYEKIFSKDRSSIYDVISMSKKRINDKVLFVVFFTRIDADIDVMEILKDGKNEIHSLSEIC